MTHTRANLIDGEHVGGDLVPDINPSDTGDVVALYAQASATQAEQAVEAARAAFSRWSRTTTLVRQEILSRASQEIFARRDELGRLLAREEGKTLAEAIGEVVRASQVIGYMAGEAVRLRGERMAGLVEGSDVEVTREPLGVVGIISPWNFPIAIPAWKIAPALACGNCVVFKPAELVPGSAWELVDILQRAGLPRGVLNLVMGRGAEVGSVLTDHKKVDAISFTGSVPTSRRIAAACVASSRMKRMQLGMVCTMQSRLCH